MRYFIATVLLTYAAPKVLGVQFIVGNYVYDTPLGEIGDFWTAWAFFAHSYYYQFFIGLAEITISFLLLFRRTKLLGSMCALPIVCNVLMVDYFFKVDDAISTAVVLFLGVVYLLALELPRLKAFFWDEQAGSSSSRKAIGSLIYGTVIFFLAVGLLAYLTSTLTSHQEGVYKIERYSMNGVPRTLSAGKYGRDPLIYFELGNNLVESLDGQHTRGNYTFNTEKQEFTLTADRKNPDAVLKGTYQTDGDEMTLRGKQGTDDVEIILRRVNRERR